MDLESVVPWGRSLAEYKSMFSLDNLDVKKSILGCSDGPASFNSELTQQGGQVISVDPVYQFTATEIQERIKQAYQVVMAQMELHQDNFVWNKIPSVEVLGQLRMKAMDQFLADFEIGKSQDITAGLPNLPFSDHQFDLALCSHYLFLYSEQISYENHLEQILELCRVAKEVRIYPLLTLHGEISSHLDRISTVLSRLGYIVQNSPVEYKFQIGAYEMLIITRF